MNTGDVFYLKVAGGADLRPLTFIGHIELTVVEARGFFSTPEDAKIEQIPNENYALFEIEYSNGAKRLYYRTMRWVRESGDLLTEAESEALLRERAEQQDRLDEHIARELNRLRRAFPRAEIVCTQGIIAPEGLRVGEIGAWMLATGRRPTDIVDPEDGFLYRPELP
jgi:hypothetical protein